LPPCFQEAVLGKAGWASITKEQNGEKIEDRQENDPGAKGVERPFQSRNCPLPVIAPEPPEPSCRVKTGPETAIVPHGGGEAVYTIRVSAQFHD